MENGFANGTPFVEKLIVLLIVSLDLNDFEELGNADVVRLMALQPPAIDTTMLDEGSESTMGLNLRKQLTHDATC